MSELESTRSEVPSPLDDILAQYIASEEAGNVVDRQALLEQHPRHASELREFFAHRDQMLRLAAPFQRAPENDGSGVSLPRVRYFGDFELLEEIAQGGTGVVYKARQTSLGRIVAVKMTPKGALAADDDI